jgi:uncharacterized protein (DUF608 family)
MKKSQPYSPKLLKGDGAQRTFSGSEALQVAFPLGGIGAGTISLNGQGGLQDFAIYGQPSMTADPAGKAVSTYGFATLRAGAGKDSVTRLVEGPLPTGKIYDQGLRAHGSLQPQDGFPRFRKAEFRGEYPLAFMNFSDKNVPLRVKLTAFNPFVPLDDVCSSMPCAVLEYTLENPTRQAVNYEFAYHLSHLAMPRGKDGKEVAAGNWVKPNAGIYFDNELDPNAEFFGSAALAVVGHRPKIKGMWLRSGWFGAMTALWRELAETGFKANVGSGVKAGGGKQVGPVGGGNGGSVLLAGTLAPGAKITYPIVIAWHFPNRIVTTGPKIEETPAPPPAAACNCGAEGCATKPAPWRPFYAGRWGNAWDVAETVRAQYESLRGRTAAFHDVLFSSTLPSYVLDAVSANLGILKSPTVLRQENGWLWAWEGCNLSSGCCNGSCTHVWNYAQALPHLFPALERTLRDQEYVYSMDEKGHVNFRTALPIRATDHNFHAAADGQLGGIMKTYRDWRISGDEAWLRRIYPLVKRSLDFCIELWDPKHAGVLVEPHHNTYDIEFWGPDGMCTGVYVGALSAMAELARAAGEAADAPYYEKIAEKGAAWMDKNLFNGEFYIQKMQYRGLRDQSFIERIACVTSQSSEVDQLLKREGPPYQYGPGCISDGVIGPWMARTYGIATPQDQAKVRKHLKAVFAYNFKESLVDHVCPQRPAYAIGDEPGLLLCSWPEGGKPTLPFPYSDEVWTGIEYQVASHLIEEGMVAEGLTIARAVRQRYNGMARNPWNEYECGNYYARAMSSYALLGALSGFRYSPVDRVLSFGPRLAAPAFRCFFSTATGWGTVTLKTKANELRIDVVEGELAVDTLRLTTGGREREVAAGVVAKPGKPAVIALAAPKRAAPKRAVAKKPVAKN